MFELSSLSRSDGIDTASDAAAGGRRSSTSWGALAGALAYRGPERRGGAALMTRLLALMLDEIDYGLLLVGDSGELLHVNHAARAELDAQHPLQLAGTSLHARYPQDVAPLTEALQAAARRGLRRMLTLGSAEHRVGLSVVPLPLPAVAMALGVSLPTRATLLVLGKRHMCAALSVQGFARTHRLSSSEEEVLSELCEGLRPNDIAQRRSVKIATVRTQIANIRAKTGVDSIRELVRAVAVLPPQVSALRGLGAVGMERGGETGLMAGLMAG
ncbi:MAG TPA: LuxR C-terminal-related transcriptional regulator [Ideonella sp.]|nr:LuxR C-terminal-related transcriptional regulator [Ideonella sp.]